MGNGTVCLATVGRARGASGVSPAARSAFR